MSERNFEVVVSDVDGTQIIHGQKLPSPEVQAAARAVRANGAVLLEATGRTRFGLRRLIAPLDLRDNLCTLDGGATVAHADSGEVVWSRWLDAERSHSVVASIGEFCVKMYYGENPKQKQVRTLLNKIQAGQSAGEITPSVFGVFDHRKGEAILEALSSVADITHTPIMEYENFEELRCIQVVAPDVDKFYGVRQMLQHGGLTDRRKLIIGDGTNDLALFKVAGPDDVKVAMGNGPQMLKDEADWVAPPVEAHGFAVALRHYGVI
jgi:hydroxymethylpyrimidine pyrophosphatase-like HAD family hydrolase